MPLAADPGANLLMGPEELFGVIMEKIQELIKYVVEHFAEQKDEIEYVAEEKDNAVEITVYLAESDMGKVIGKQGKIAKALRTLVSAYTPRGAKRYIVEIKEKA